MKRLMAVSSHRLPFVIRLQKTWFDDLIEVRHLKELTTIHEKLGNDSPSKIEGSVLEHAQSSHITENRTTRTLIMQDGIKAIRPRVKEQTQSKLPIACSICRVASA